MKLSPGIDFSPDAEFEEEERLIPYSLSPSWNESEDFPGLSRLNDQHKLLDECLGNLHCAPPHRIGFSFEKARLRVLGNKSSLSDGLKKIQSFLKLLEGHGGSFEVVDVDDRESSVVYDHQNQENRSYDYRWHQEKMSDSDPRVLMAGAALFAEQFTLQVPPVHCTLKKRVGEPAVVVHRGATRWYRIINLRGIAAIIGPESDQPAEHQTFSCIEALCLIFPGWHPFSDRIIYI